MVLVTTNTPLRTTGVASSSGTVHLAASIGTTAGNQVAHYVIRKYEVSFATWVLHLLLAYDMSYMLNAHTIQPS